MHKNSPTQSLTKKNEHPIKYNLLFSISNQNSISPHLLILLPKYTSAEYASLMERNASAEYSYPLTYGKKKKYTKIPILCTLRLLD